MSTLVPEPKHRVGDTVRYKTGTHRVKAKQWDPETKTWKYHLVNAGVLRFIRTDAGKNIPEKDIKKHYSFGESVESSFVPAVKTSFQYQGKIHGKEYLVPHARYRMFRKEGSAEPLRYAIVTSRAHVQNHNPNLTPQEIDRVHGHIKDIHGGQELSEDLLHEAKAPIRGDVFHHHQTLVAKKTLRMPDAMVNILGGQTKEEARDHLKKMGWTKKQIHDHEHETAVHLSEDHAHQVGDTVHYFHGTTGHMRKGKVTKRTDTHVIVKPEGSKYTYQIPHTDVVKNYRLQKEGTMLHENIYHVWDHHGNQHEVNATSENDAKKKLVSGHVPSHGQQIPMTQWHKIKVAKKLTEQVYPNGTQVRIPHNGQMVTGKIVRHDKGDPHGSPFYVVDHGAYASAKVPAHKVELHTKNTKLEEAKKTSSWEDTSKFRHHMNQVNRYLTKKNPDKKKATFHFGQAIKAHTAAEKIKIFRESSESLQEKTLTPAETAKKEEMVKSMKPKLQSFKSRYGSRAKNVMYATATKHAKELAESFTHKTGDGKKHESLEAAKSHANAVHKKTGNIISVEPIKKLTEAHAHASYHATEDGHAHQVKSSYSNGKFSGTVHTSHRDNRYRYTGPESRSPIEHEKPAKWTHDIKHGVTASAIRKKNPHLDATQARAVSWHFNDRKVEGKFLKESEQLDEVSLKLASSAYARRMRRGDNAIEGASHYAKGKNTKAYISKKFGEAGVKRAEKHDSDYIHKLSEDRDQLDEASDFMTTYKRNESQNRHTQNLVHLTKHFGTEAEQDEAKFYADELKKHGHQPHHEAAYQLHSKLWPKAVKAHEYGKASGRISEGVEQHAALADHTQNPYHKILTKHGFTHSATTHEKNRFSSNPDSDYTQHRYTHPQHGKSHVEVVQYHTTSHGGKRGAYNAYWRHRHEQSNGIMAPSTGETKPQLDKALAQEYGRIHESVQLNELKVPNSSTFNLVKSIIRERNGIS